MTTSRDASAAGPATYVYCLVQSRRPPSLDGVPRSVPGAGAPRLRSFGPGLWAVVSDAPLNRFSAEQLQHDLNDLETVSRHAVAHASIIEFFFERSPVIPLQLFTLFTDDERMRRHLATRVPRLTKLFESLRGFQEWGIRITGGPDKESEPAPHQPTGKDYLRRKKRLLDQQPVLSRTAVRDAGSAIKTLSGLAGQVKKGVLSPPGRSRPFVVGASFLVKATRRARWSALVTKVSERLAEQGHRLEVSGPWPPYHFASGRR